MMEVSFGEFQERTLEVKVNVDQICGEGQTKETGYNSHEIDNKACGLEVSRVNLLASLAVADQSHQTNKYSRNDRYRAEPYRKAGCWHNMPLALQLHPLPDGDSKAANRKTKYDDGNPGADPSE